MPRSAPGWASRSAASGRTAAAAWTSCAAIQPSPAWPGRAEQPSSALSRRALILFSNDVSSVRFMDRGPDGADSHTPGVRGSRRLLAAGLAAVVVLLGVIAVLATRLAGTASDASAQAATLNPTPTTT